MGRFVTRKRPAEHFSILVVPRNRSNIRRLELSRRTIRIATGGVVLCAFVACTMFYSLLFYRRGYRTTQDMRVQAANFVRERAALLGRLEELESSLSRTERFVVKIGSALDTRKGRPVGEGPVDEKDWLPETEGRKSPRSSFQLGSGVWKSPFSNSFTAGLNLSIDELASRTKALEGQVHAVFSSQQDKLFFWASLPSIWPTRGWVTSGFGARRGWGGNGRRHEGIDIAAPRGTAVVASGDGVVTYVGYRGGYGRTMVIDHGYGLASLYAHCSVVYASEGEKVKRGMIVASVGNSGRSSGPHLHYEVHVDGMPIDPMLYIMNSL